MCEFHFTHVHTVRQKIVGEYTRCFNIVYSHLIPVLAPIERTNEIIKRGKKY